MPYFTQMWTVDMNSSHYLGLGENQSSQSCQGAGIRACCIASPHKWWIEAGAKAEKKLQKDV